MDNLYKLTIYEGEPEEYVTFCSPEGKHALTRYFDIRRRHGEEITDQSPVIREKYDRRDQLKVKHPKHVPESTLSQTLVELAEVAGIPNRIKIAEGQRAATVRNEIPICN